MSLKVSNDLHSLNSSFGTSLAEKTELFDISNFQLDENQAISSREMEILPIDYKNDLRNIFFSVINRSDVQKEIKKQSATTISLKTVNGKIVYKLSGSKDYKTIQDEKIQKAFKRVAIDIKQYLNNLGTVKERQLSMSKIDRDIIESCPNDVEKVSKEVFKKMKKSDSEWSLWAVWACSLRDVFDKICAFLGIKFDFEIPQGIDDIIAYLFGFFGILNGNEIEKDSKKIGDIEGQKEGRQKILRNVLSIIGTIIDFIGKTLIQAGNALLKVVLGTIASVIFFIVTLYALLKYSYLWIEALVFKRKFSKYTENQKLTIEQRMLSALKFLKNRVTVTNEEAYDILNKVREQNPISSDYKIKKLAHDEISKKLLTKVKRFERRVGDGLVGPIQENVDKILKNPKDPNNIKKAELILKKVHYKSDLNIQENKWNAIATLFEVAQIILLVVFGYVTLAALSGALSSAISVIMIGAYFYRKHVAKEKELKSTLLDEKLDLLADPAI